MENVKKFFDALAGDDAMKERANAVNSKYEGKQPDDETTTAAIIEFAKAEGYSFTAEEYKAYADQTKKVSDDELEAVAGGSNTWSQCLCVGGGFGKNDPEDLVCACVVGGGGEQDHMGYTLACVAIGDVMGGF